MKSVWIEYRNTAHTKSRFHSYLPILSHYLLQLLRRLLTNGPRFIIRRADSKVTKPHPLLSVDSITINFIDLAQDLVKDDTAALTGYRLNPRSYARDFDLTLKENKRCENGEWDWRVDYQEQRDLWYLHHFVDQIAEIGILASRVRTLRLCCGSASKQWLLGTRCKIENFRIEEVKPREVGSHKWGPFFHYPYDPRY